MKTTHPDKAIIDALGGAAEVARKLGLDPANGGVQRVHNWTTRGIPDAVKWNHQDIFGEAPAKTEAA
jgi:hypothetical protein